MSDVTFLEALAVHAYLCCELDSVSSGEAASPENDALRIELELLATPLDDRPVVVLLVFDG